MNMDDPIPIRPDQAGAAEQSVTAEEWMKYNAQKQQERRQWVALIFVLLLLGGLLAPLIIWLIRLSLGD